MLYQAPRHHASWPRVSAASATLLSVLVHMEEGAEAAQPQALSLLLGMLGSPRSCAAARQAVASTLHGLAASQIGAAALCVALLAGAWARPGCSAAGAERLEGAV